jgi:hypothetical protein
LLAGLWEVVSCKDKKSFFSMKKMAGIAIFDGALVAYPLYQTSKHVSARFQNTNADQDGPSVDQSLVPKRVYDASSRWLMFWTTFSVLKITEQFGMGGVPGFHFFKALLLLSMYSAEHGAVMGALFPRLCFQYISLSDRVVQWWNETALQRAEALEKVNKKSGGWLSSAYSSLQMWWSNTKNQHRDDDSGDGDVE